MNITPVVSAAIPMTAAALTLPAPSHNKTALPWSSVLAAVFDAVLRTLMRADDCTHSLPSVTAHCREAKADADTATVAADVILAVHCNKSSTYYIRNIIDEFAAST